MESTYLRVPGKSMLLQKILGGDHLIAVAPRPSLGATGSGIVFRQSKRKRIRLFFPMLEAVCRYQVPAFRLIFGSNNSSTRKFSTLFSCGPFLGRFLADLHEAALAGRPIFCGSSRLSRQTTAFTTSDPARCSGSD